MRASAVPCAVRLQNAICEPAGVRRGAGGPGALALGLAWLWFRLGKPNRGERNRAARGWAEEGLASASPRNPCPSAGAFLASFGREGARADSCGAVNLCEQRLPFGSGLPLWLCRREAVLSPRSCLRQLASSSTQRAEGASSRRSLCRRGAGPRDGRLQGRDGEREPAPGLAAYGCRAGARKE